MACFAAPAAEAVVTTIVKRKIGENSKLSQNPFFKRIGWLNNMLWGGSVLLAFEHIWHGEIVPFFPFLTGTDVLREIATSGTAMAVLVTAVWAVMAMAANSIEKKALTVKADA